MSEDIAIETRVPPELGEALDRLASARGLSKAALVREALAEFVLSEEAFTAAVEEGSAAIEAGDFVDHEEVMRQIDEMLSEE